MKKIKIRFIETTDREGKVSYKIQRKSLFGWKYITYFVGSIHGDSYYHYTKSTKEELLEKVLKCYYQTCRDFVLIVEYPTIKKY